jgi:ethanolamine utilization microcompartment shell protein EutS
MAAETQAEPEPLGNPWDDASLALLVGIAVMGTMVFLAAVIRPPGLAPPPAGAIPLFVFTTTAATMSIILVRQTDVAGYAAAVVTGILDILSVFLVATGTFGDVSSSGIQPGPIVFTALGLAVVATSVLAWRKRSAAEISSPSSSPS